MALRLPPIGIEFGAALQHNETVYGDAGRISASLPPFGLSQKVASSCEESILALKARHITAWAVRPGSQWPNAGGVL